MRLSRHHPLVYALTIDSECPDDRLTDITRFARFDYSDEANLEVVFQVVPTNSCFAGDYRAAGKLLADDVAVFTTAVMPSYFRILEAVI